MEQSKRFAAYLMENLERERVYFRSYANQSILVRYECNRHIHRARFKHIGYQQQKTPVGLIMALSKSYLVLYLDFLLNSSLLLSKCLWRYDLVRESNPFEVFSFSFIGNTFPRGLLLVLLFVILFIIATAIWIFFQCRRHYPERNAYGAIASSKELTSSD